MGAYDVVILFVHANPDGMDLCADWYMREKDPKKRSLYDQYGPDGLREGFDPAVANGHVEAASIGAIQRTGARAHFA